MVDILNIITNYKVITIRNIYYFHYILWTVASSLSPSPSLSLFLSLSLSLSLSLRRDILDFLLLVYVVVSFISCGWPWENILGMLLFLIKYREKKEQWNNFSKYIFSCLCYRLCWSLDSEHGSKRLMWGEVEVSSCDDFITPWTDSIPFPTQQNVIDNTIVRKVPISTNLNKTEKTWT